jgi:predicted nucleic acid-binding protein
MVTLDANVWIAAFDPHDHFYTPSLACLHHIGERQLIVYGPAFVVIETGCAVARRLHDPKAGKFAMQQLRRNPLLTLLPLEDRLLALAEDAGVRYLLRSADALYVAAAALANAPLLTWDQELVSRTGAVTPVEWLENNR